MSIGYQGFAVLVEQDDECAIYSYGCSNWNDEKYENHEHVKDGLITINKASLPEPEIHIKRKRFPGGRKRMVEKRIPVDVSFEELFASGGVSVDNSAYCWRTAYDEVDFIALKLLYKIFRDYQLNDSLPEITGFVV